MTMDSGPKSLFSILGVEARFHLSPDDLEGRFKALSQRLHPDRFARADAKERLRALQASTELNDAYRLLKVPARRGEYLLKLAGVDVTEEGSSDAGRRVKIDPALLLELLEEREALAEAKAAGDRDKIGALRAAAEARRAETLAKIERDFLRFDEGDRSVVDGLARALIELRYCDKLLAEVEAILEEQP